tara:strand:- start:82655 stop:83077 length:423 start_codon:yes stop_codon:yes gene_type:complete
MNWKELLQDPISILSQPLRFRLTPEIKLWSAWRELKAHRLPAAPVFEGDSIIGYISSESVEAVTAVMGMANIDVYEIMQKTMTKVTSNTSIEEALALAGQQGSSFILIQGVAGETTGFVSVVEAFKKLGNMANQAAVDGI